MNQDAAPKTLTARQRAEANQHAIELEQCSIVVESPPIAKAMTQAAAFLREMAKPPAPGETVGAPQSDRTATLERLLRDADAYMSTDPEYRESPFEQQVLAALPRAVATIPATQSAA